MSRRNRPRTLGKLAGAGLLLYLLMRSGRAWAFGRKAGDGAPARTPRGCFVQLLGTGELVVDGEPATLDDALACANAAGVAHVFVQGDAPFGDYVDLRRAFEDAGIPIVQALPRSASHAS